MIRIADAKLPAPNRHYSNRVRADRRIECPLLTRGTLLGNQEFGHF